MVLFEHDRGITQPTKWHRDLCENVPLQWLLMGSVPSLTSLYEFRDRLSRFLPQWNDAVIGQAIAEGHTEAEVASLDGSTVAANASHHHLLNLEQLDRRIEQLERVDSDVAAAPDRGSVGRDLARNPASPGQALKVPRGERRRTLDREERELIAGQSRGRQRERHLVE